MICLLFNLLYPNAYVHYELQRVFSHDLLEPELVEAGFIQLNRLICDADAMLKNIVHPTAQPALIVGCQQHVKALLRQRVRGHPGIHVHPKILVAVCVGMSYYEINIIERSCIAYFQLYFRFERAAPFMIWNAYIFFKNINSLTR